MLDFLAVLFIMFWSKCGGDFAVEGSEVGFELFQFVLFAPRLRYDGLELGNIGFEFGCAFLILGDDAGYFSRALTEFMQAAWVSLMAMKPLLDVL